MSKRITIELTVVVTDEANPDAVAEELFDFLGDDPDDLFPLIEEIESFEATEHADG